MCVFLQVHTNIFVKLFVTLSPWSALSFSHLYRHPHHPHTRPLGPMYSERPNCSALLARSHEDEALAGVDLIMFLGEEIVLVSDILPPFPFPSLLPFFLFSVCGCSLFQHALVPSLVPSFLPSLPPPGWTFDVCCMFVCGLTLHS